jgi:hypothetical protein
MNNPGDLSPRILALIAQWQAEVDRRTQLAPPNDLNSGTAAGIEKCILELEGEVPGDGENERVNG